MIKKILTHKVFADRPPVLMDIGASGGIHKIWKNIAKYCVCIGFDPDERDISVSQKTGRKFKDFYLINRIVSDTPGITDFYLTQSPHCSSTLKPDRDHLGFYDLAHYFKIHKQIQLPAITVNAALKEAGYDYIDWFKTDTQGTDLRIFTAIDEAVRNKILVAEFEPGILDAYHGEDKLYKVMEYFDGRDFWCDACTVKGLSRIDADCLRTRFNRFEKVVSRFLQKPCAFWAEISYMNQMKQGQFDQRAYLLMSVFALVKKQYGFAMEICTDALKTYDDGFFAAIREYALAQMRLHGYMTLPVSIAKAAIKKLVGR